MLEKPAIRDEAIIICLQNEYQLNVGHVEFLPLGADLDTAVYRVTADDKTPYFLKLRSGIFDETSVTFSKFLSDLGMAQIIAPLPTHTGQLWANLDPYKTILYPFIEGRNAYDVAMSDHHWQEFGCALNRIHTADVPPSITDHIRREQFSPQFRETVKAFLMRAEDGTCPDPIAAELATLLKTKHSEIRDLVARADRYAAALQAQSLELIVCHADMHAWNILISDKNAFYIVDWDTLTLAPKERDLMFIGGGLMGGWHTPDVERQLFYGGYGQTEINPIALSYYRYERIIEDMAICCEELLLSDKGGKDRERSLAAFKSNFRPDGTIEIAYKADRS